MTVVALLLAGLAIGLMLGVLGAGGAILTAPILVTFFGLGPVEATSVSLVVVLLAAVSGLVGRSRAGKVRWVAGLVFGAVGAVGAVAGARLAASVPEPVLLGAFAALLVVAAFAMWRQDAARAPQRRGWPTVVVAAIGVGLVTGFFGVGGGFVVVPALVLVVGCPVTSATGTALVVIAVNASAALVARGQDHLPWDVALPMALGAVVGSYVGGRYAMRVPAARLRRGFAVLMFASAALVAVQAHAA